MTTFTGFFKLQLQLQMSKDNSVWLDSNSACPAERYVVVVFEKVLSSQETHVLETIFREIGRASKLENFPTNFPYKEACERLMAIKKMPSSSGSDSLTLSIIDTDDDDDDDQLPQIPTDEVQLIFKGDPGRRLVVYPPPPAKGGISVTEEDLYRLDEGEFLNDVIIDFYLKFLVSEKLQKEDTDRTYIFSSFFFKHLTQEEWRAVLDDENVPMPERRHSRVKTWTRHVDLFQKDFIFVPINMSAHWFLAVICFPGRQNQDVEEQHSGCMDLPPVCEGGLKYLWSDQDICPPNPMSLFYRGSPDYTDINSSTQDNMATFENTINTVKKSKGIHPKPASNEKPCILIMDSLGHYRSSVVKTLQEYLEVEWRTKKGTLRTFQQGAMEGYCPSVPQQDNFSDCGVYLLQYVESFFESPLQSFLAPMDLSHWFPQKVVKKKRYEIRKLILKMHKQQKTCKSFQVI
ncbi:sentrin-specific protease 6 isoform X2 [Denticeps clupeoides]|uniref:sentrin-specific protease 6 isoform X2 n=1 Tax=Denticeps clupeoides TaxID=299321 RepID=UPI0010A4442B|nr:sentrin-specific protease 6-like isoform X2 [Denticeps clupeoides]